MVPMAWVLPCGSLLLSVSFCRGVVFCCWSWGAVHALALRAIAEEWDKPNVFAAPGVPASNSPGSCDGSETMAMVVVVVRAKTRLASEGTAAAA